MKNASITTLKSIFSFQTFLLCFAVYNLWFLQIEGFAGDPGMGWHLATGKIIAETGAIPLVDPFLAGAPARPWISDQWLADLFFYKLFVFGGYPFVAGVLAALFVCVFFAVLWPALKVGARGAELPLLLAVLFAFKLAQIHFLLRATVLGIILFALLFAAFNSRFRERTALFSLFLIALFAFWANLHPSFSLGLIYLGVYLICSFLPVFFHGVETPIIGSVQAITFLAAAFIGSLLNPFGLDLHRSVLVLGGSDYFMNLNQEWLSPNFKDIAGQLILVFLALPFIGTYLSKGRFFRSAPEFLIYSFFALCTLRSIRFAPYLAIVAVPLVAQAISLIVSSLGNLRGQIFYRLSEKFLVLCAHERQARSAPVLAALLSLVLILFPQQIAAFGLAPLKEKFPYGGVEFLRSAIETKAQQSSSDAVEVVLAHPNFGGFITWMGAGRVKAVIDDRNTMLGEGWYKRFLKDFTASGDLPGLLKEVGATSVLVMYDSELAAYLRVNPAFQQVFADGVSVVFRPLVSPAPARLP